jgi:hypothetical protein
VIHYPSGTWQTSKARQETAAGKVFLQNAFQASSKCANPQFAVYRSLVQPTLRSALQGWGVGSLQQDADDLLMLTKYLKAEHASEVSFQDCLGLNSSSLCNMMECLDVLKHT